MFGIVPAMQARILSLGFWPEIVRKFIAHPAGPFTSKYEIINSTVFFWAPTFKWMITLSNISDMKRPAQLVSVN